MKISTEGVFKITYLNIDEKEICDFYVCLSECYDCYPCHHHVKSLPWLDNIMMPIY